MSSLRLIVVSCINAKQQNMPSWPSSAEDFSIIRDLVRCFISLLFSLDPVEAENGMRTDVALYLSFSFVVPKCKGRYEFKKQMKRLNLPKRLVCTWGFVGSRIQMQLRLLALSTDIFSIYYEALQ